MKIKKILFVLGSGFLFLVVFIIDAILKNIEGGLDGIFFIRVLLVAAAFVLLYFYVDSKIKSAEGGERSQIQRLGAVAVWTGILIASYIIVSILPLNWFESRDLQLYPRDYLTILFSTLLSIVSGLAMIITVRYVKEMLFYRRTRGTKRNFVLLLVVMFCAAASTYNLRPLETSLGKTILFTVAIFFIIVNSFRLSWIAYLSRREKIYALLYALLAFFGFMAINIILSEMSSLTKALLYFNYPLFVFVQLSALFGSVYFGMAFISTLFHLPTAAAFDRKQHEVSSLYNLSRLITQVFDFNDLAKTVTKMTLEVCEASGAWLEVLPSDGAKEFGKKAGEHRLDGIVSRHNIEPEAVEQILFGSEQSVRSLVLSSKKILLVDNVKGDRRTSYISRIRNVGTLLVVPLVSHDEPIGILYATKEIDHGFEDDDVNIVSGFADHVTIAIENAKLFKKSLEKERLQRELLIAQEMQKRLIPQTLPFFSSADMKAVSAPALEVGGDYYDIVMLDEHRIGIVIGDVSGKGVGAAFYMAEVKGIFQSLSKIYSSPKEFLVKANEALISSIDKRSFISLIYAILDTRTGELVLSRAGHCPMLYVSFDKKQYVKPTGMGLGLRAGKLFEETIEERHITMKKGDVCVFYTDGVTESRSSTGEEFGYERLLDLVAAHRNRSAEEIKEGIIQGVWNYTDEHGYDDDLTVFVLKWQGV
ncbi:MAG: SpoIIE family protein phosphatase [Bacteroidota bacterium]|nr:SpoIIE family protein phosphatase [Bacteroidota bacterium]